MPFVTLGNENPNFFRGLEAEPADAALKERSIIYSTFDGAAQSLWLGQVEHATAQITQIDKGHSLTVFALDVTLFGEIKVPRGDVRIHCRTLRVAGKDGVTIDLSAVRPSTMEKPLPAIGLTDARTPAVNGEDGDAIKLKNKPYGEAGAAGGSITIVCDALVLDAPLNLVSHGADGYAGCDGQSGSPRAIGHLPGAGGKGGTGGAGGPGGSIDLRYVSVTHPERLTLATGPGKPGPAGTPGRMGGEAGGMLGPSASPAEPGVAGDALVQVVDRAAIGKSFDEIFLFRVAQRAKQLYLFNQPERFSGDATTFPAGWAELGSLLAWLEDVLGNPSGASTQEELRRADLRHTCKKLRSQHKNKRTSFSWDANWVPSNKLEDMVKSYARSAAARQGIEASYLALAAKYKTNADAQRERDKARDALRVTRETHNASYQAIQDQLRESLAPIGAAVHASEASRDELQTALKTFTTTVKDYFNITFEALLHAAEMIVFTLGDPAQCLAMGAVEVATLVNDGLTKIKTNDGNDIQKSAVIKEIQATGTQIAAATHGEVFELDENGKPVIDAAHAKAFGELAKFRADAANLSTTFGEKVIGAVIAALDAFTGTAMAKGEAIAMYRMLALRLIEARDRLDVAESELKKLEDQPDLLDPQSVGTVSLYAKLYQDQLEAAMEDYSLLRRKYFYVTLKPAPDALGAATSQLWTSGRPPDTAQLDTLAGNVADMQRELGKWGATQPGTSATFPAARLRSDLRIHIAPGSFIDQFKQQRRIRFTTLMGNAMIPLMPANRSSADPVPLRIDDSELFHDVRITHFQPRLIGAKTRSGNLTIKIRMSGWSQIYDAKPAVFTFSHHLARVTSITHRCDTPGSNQKDVPHFDDNSDLGTGTLGEVSDSYLDSVGVFSTWEIWIPETQGADSTNADLDLRGLTDIFVHFRGSRRTTDNAENGR